MFATDILHSLNAELHKYTLFNSTNQGMFPALCDGWKMHEGDNEGKIFGQIGTLWPDQ